MTFFFQKIFPVESLVTTLGPLAPRWSSLLQNYPPQPWANGRWCWTFYVGYLGPFDLRIRIFKKNTSKNIHHSSLPPKTHNRENLPKSLYTNILPTKSSPGTSQPFNFHLPPSLGVLKLLKSTIQHWKSHSACPFPSDVANLSSRCHDVLENCHFLPTFCSFERS